MIHRNEMETLKKNVYSNYNKEYTNLQNRKSNEIEMIKKEMNIALDNLDKRFNKRRHDIIVIERNKNLLKNNIPLAKSQLVNRTSTTPNKRVNINIKRVFSPKIQPKTKIKIIKPSSKGKRKQSAKSKKK